MPKQCLCQVAKRTHKEPRVINISVDILAKRCYTNDTERAKTIINSGHIGSNS